MNRQFSLIERLVEDFNFRINRVRFRLVPSFRTADSKAESKMWSNSHVVLLENQMKRIAPDSNLLNLISGDPYGAISTFLRLGRD